MLTHFTFGRESTAAEVEAFDSAVRRGFFPCWTSVDFAFVVWAEADGALEGPTEIGMKVGLVEGMVVDRFLMALKACFPRHQLVELGELSKLLSELRGDPRLTLRTLKVGDPLVRWSERPGLGLGLGFGGPWAAPIPSLLGQLWGEPLPALQTLILHCTLEAEDLLSLSEAEAGGNLPNLHHLDISGRRGDLQSLFSRGNKWNQLHILKAYRAYPAYTKDNPGDFQVLCSCASQGGLRSLRELHLPFSLMRPSVAPSPDLFPCLQVSSFKRCGSEQNEADLVMMQDLIKDGYFPALNTVIFYSDKIVREEIQRLRQNHPGLKVYDWR